MRSGKAIGARCRELCRWSLGRLEPPKSRLDFGCRPSQRDGEEYLLYVRVPPGSNPNGHRRQVARSIGTRLSEPEHQRHHRGRADGRVADAGDRAGSARRHLRRAAASGWSLRCGGRGRCVRGTTGAASEQDNRQHDGRVHQPHCPWSVGRGAGRCPREPGCFSGPPRFRLSAPTFDNCRPRQHHPLRQPPVQRPRAPGRRPAPTEVQWRRLFPPRIPI